MLLTVERPKDLEAKAKREGLVSGCHGNAPRVNKHLSKGDSDFGRQDDDGPFPIQDVFRGLPNSFEMSIHDPALTTQQVNAKDKGERKDALCIFCHEGPTAEAEERAASMFVPLVPVSSLLESGALGYHQSSEILSKMSPLALVRGPRGDRPSFKLA